MKTKVYFLLLLSLTLNSCFIGKSIEAAAARSEFTEENDAIPPEFGSDKNVFVIGILQGRKSYDNHLKKVFKKNYKGNYILIPINELSNPEYNNKELYRYIFNYSGGSSSSTTYSNGLSSSVTYKRFFIKDRSIDKKYECGAEFTFFGKAMSIYIENLETKRNSQ